MTGRAGNPIDILGLDHLVLRVADLGKMLDFYVGVLGCTLEKEQAGIGLYQVRAGAQLIDLVTLDGKLGRMGGRGPGAEGRNLDHFCLEIRHFDEPALRAYLSAAGVEAGETGTRYGAKGNGPSIYLSDPEGNIVELKGPSPGA